MIQPTAMSTGVSSIAFGAMTMATGGLTAADCDYDISKHNYIASTTNTSEGSTLATGYRTADMGTEAPDDHTGIITGTARALRNWGTLKGTSIASAWVAKHGAMVLVAAAHGSHHGIKVGGHVGAVIGAGVGVTVAILGNQYVVDEVTASAKKKLEESALEKDYGIVSWAKGVGQYLTDSFTKRMGVSAVGGATYGAITGAIVGGPIGALAGAAIGSILFPTANYVKECCSQETQNAFYWSSTAGVSAAMFAGLVGGPVAFIAVGAGGALLGGLGSVGYDRYWQEAEDQPKVIVVDEATLMELSEVRENERSILLANKLAKLDSMSFDDSHQDSPDLGVTTSLTYSQNTTQKGPEPGVRQFKFSVDSIDQPNKKLGDEPK